MGSASPVLPPSAPGSSEEPIVPDDRELAAVVAHGLLNTLAVLSSATGALMSYGDALLPTVAAGLVTTIVLQSKLIGDGLVIVLPHASESFNVAAAGIAASGVLLAVPGGASAELLADLVADCATVRGGLGSLVRGLPDEVVEFLDRLRR